MEKRTIKQIEEDYVKIKNYAFSNDVCSFEELSNATGLSYWEIKTSLSRHPIIDKKIRGILIANRAKAKELAKAEKAKADELAKAEKAKAIE